MNKETSFVLFKNHFIIVDYDVIMSSCSLSKMAGL